MAKGAQMHRHLMLIALLSLTFLRPSLTAAEFPIITTVDLVDVPGAYSTNAYAINDRGQIVGSFTEDSVTQHGFLRSNGQFTTIDVPEGTETTATGIDSAGRIVGHYKDSVGRLHGFLLAGSQFTTIDPPNSVQTQLWGINDLGQIIGVFVDSAGTVRNFLGTNGQFVALTPTAQFPVLQPHGINGRGQIVGYSTSRFGFRLEPRGDITALTIPGSQLTQPFGINMLGEVVGEVVIDLGPPGGPPDAKGRGFLLAYGAYTLIDVPGSGSDGTSAIGINNRHQIIGWYHDRSTGSVRERSYLFTPPNENADVSGSASADRSRVPQEPVVFDSDLTPWSLGPGQEILHNGAQAAGGYGSQILWYQGSIYVLGDDSYWWRWTGSTWTFAGPNDPTL